MLGKFSKCKLILFFSGEITLKVHYDTARVKRSTENVFPENLDVQIPVVFNHVTLSLRKNGRITHHMPVTVERNGKIIYHKLPKTQVGVFYKGNCMGYGVFAWGLRTLRV